MRVRRNREEISRVVEEYRASGLTRVEYSRRSGIALSTLSNYCRRQKTSGLVRVQVEKAPKLQSGFALVLARGRRVEIGGQFDEAELIRLIRVIEAA
ncbi:MAG TPA: hypothetical protein VES20_13315 [Bryobacteraceae bacterium]|nr:hypothetical protein [Bryobacteraceae bacterium]